MKNAYSELCWESLLSIAETIKNSKERVEFCCVNFTRKGLVHLNRFPSKESKDLTAAFFLDSRNTKPIPDHIHAAFLIENIIRVSEMIPSRLPREFNEMIKTYAPYCFSSLYARDWDRAFGISHLAQTLDGRIATVTGDSKWIGSEGNFVHAHRMRALVDGILIGSKTLAKDRPQLTVRHVSGKNPRPIVIGSSPQILKYLIQNRAETIFFITSRAQVNDPNRAI